MTTYGPYLVVVPALDETDLVYSEAETKQIFRFFYPSWTELINNAEIDNVGKAYAQTMIIAAVEATYQMGYLKDTLDVLTGTLKSKDRAILSLIQKLGKKYVKTWWHNATKKNLDNPEINVTAQTSIAGAFSTRAYDYISGTRALSGNFLKNGFRSHFFG
jgi:hypothetical protein